MNCKPIIGMLISVLVSTGALARPTVDVKQVAVGVCVVDGKPVDPESLKMATAIVNVVEKSQDVSPTALNSLVLAQSTRERIHHSDLDGRTLWLFEKTVREELQANLSDIERDEACIYANYYSLDELRQLRAFYESPLGRKALANDSEIASEAVVLGQALNESGMARAAVERAKQKLRAQGIKL